MTHRAIEVAGVLRAAIEAARAGAEARSVRLTAAYEDLVCAVDGNGFPQLLHRLVDRVVGLTPDGGKVHGRVSRHDERAHVVLIGTGEPLPDQELSSARQMIERLGGSIETYADARGGGATLGILLPIA